MTEIGCTIQVQPFGVMSGMEVVESKGFLATGTTTPGGLHHPRPRGPFFCIEVVNGST